MQPKSNNKRILLKDSENIQKLNNSNLNRLGSFSIQCYFFMPGYHQRYITTQDEITIKELSNMLELSQKDDRIGKE